MWSAVVAHRDTIINIDLRIEYYFRYLSGADLRKSYSEDNIRKTEMHSNKEIEEEINGYLMEKKRWIYSSRRKRRKKFRDQNQGSILDCNMDRTQAAALLSILSLCQ